MSRLLRTSMLVFSFLLYAGFVLVLLLIMAHNLLLTFLLVLTLLGVASAAWSAFRHGPSLRRGSSWLLAASAAALIIELLVLLSEPVSRRAVLIVALTAFLYAAITGWLYRRQWKFIGAHKVAEKRFRNPYLIVNPVAGNGRALKARIPELASEQGITVLMTQPERDVGALAEQAFLSGADVLGISGGDGSIGAVAAVAIHHRLPMVVLPGGTRCHFARDLGLDPEFISAALAGFNGEWRYVDVAEINGRVFLNNASFGLYADIVDHPDYRQHKLRVTRDVLKSLATGRRQPYPLRFKLGKQQFNHAVQVLVGVNRYETVNLFELGHRDTLDAGHLQVLVLTELDQNVVRQLFRSAPVDIVGRQQHGLQERTTTSFHIAGKGQQLVVGVDGERVVCRSPVTIKLLPRALEVYVPSGTGQRRRNPFDPHLRSGQRN